MEIFANISLSCLEDLSKYGKLFKEENVKINKSKIARSLNVDRRTVTKYLNGYSKPITGWIEITGGFYPPFFYT